MSARPLLLLVAVLGSVAVWLAVAGRGWDARADGPVAVREREAPAVTLALTTSDEALSAMASREAVVEELEPDGRPRQPASDRTGAVRVRVQLALASAEPSSASFAGWPVRVQTWIEATNEVFLHEAPADEHGLAELVFPGFVHVDWILCLPPDGSGLALGYAEHHVDLEPGAVLNETIELGPAGRIAGRVVDLDGRPVADARVHAFADEAPLDAGGWFPGLVVAVSDADGRFELGRLARGAWEVVVDPRTDEGGGGWLALMPPFGAAVGGLNAFDLAAGEAVDGAELVVVPAEILRVRVVDAAGEPVAGAWVHLRPRELAASGLAADDAEEPDPIELFLGRAQRPGARRWLYGDLAATADARGEAVLVGVRGRWELHAGPPLLENRGAFGTTQETLELPTGERTVRLPAALARLRGRVVDPDGRPIAGAYASILRVAPDGGALGVATDADGGFALTALPPSGDYVLTIGHGEHLAARFPVDPVAEPEPAPFVLRRASSVELELVDAFGAPVRGALEIVAVLPDEPVRPCDAPGIDALARLGPRPTGWNGRTVFEQLPPGRVELALHLPVDTGEHDRSGRPEIRLERFRTSVVPADGTQRVVADVAGYVAPLPYEPAVHDVTAVDALTGEALAGVEIRIVAGDALLASRRSNARGRLRLPTAPGQVVVEASVAGHVPAAVGPVDCAAGEHAHVIALERGGHPLALDVLDRDGLPLAIVDVGLRAPPPRGAIWTREDGAWEPWHAGRIGTDGRLELFAFPGPLELEFSIEGHPLEACTVAVAPGLAPQAETVRLRRSLVELRAEIERAEDE